ncbi:uncharacterized protein LOC109863920 isoform X2 [Pseudomyrmex gracilis]|uniref:uncharacterized protein LOC109863920 isoform X2 n=1 Tax=Pseudomyrmex gracilis TaxID=219809 RepID=UPI000994968F|nr:uncharacterized protein LOC109863920 isoform X2 [Pseudomyrmex gracilis]
MSRLGTYLSACLEWQIILINVLGIASFKNWYREREKSEVENISNLQLLQYDGKDSWYKTILLWITNVRFVIDRIKIFACASNIVTIFAQSWRYLLIPWMLLSFIQDVLEIVIIVTMSLLWYEKNVPTLKFVEFIVEKLVWIVISSYEWYTTLKWYMQLRKAEKLRKLTIIARRSIADIFQVPGRVGHSLDDELLAIAEARRDRYASTASLLNLNSLSMESSRGNFELRVSKSLSTKISDNSRESNNSKDSVANNLSAAEKSMKMLNVTAEDVMDARARIQEKSFYWSEQNVSQKMFEAMEEVILEQEKEEINNEFMKNEQIATNNRKEATNSTSRKEVNVKNSLTEKDDRKKTLIEKKKAKKTETKYQCNQNAMLQGTKIENSEIAEKFVQCPSKNEKNMNFQLSTSLVKKTEAKLDSNSASREKWIDLNNQKEHSRDVETKKLTPTDSNNDRKEKRYKDLRMSSCEFHRAMYTNGSCIGSAADDNVKDVKDDVDKKEAKRFVSCVNTQRREKLNGHSRLNYSEIYRLKKQIQKSNESCGKQPNTWGSKSLAETARPSGYAKHFVATDRSRFICQNAQTEIFDKSDDSSNVRSKMKQIGRIENNRSVELHSVYNRISLKRKNYVKSEEHEAELLISDNNLALLKDKKARKKRVLSPKKLSIEKCEAIERTALRAYNELTLLEDKKRLETKKKRDLNCEQSMEKLNAPERQVYEDLILLRDNQEMETIKRHNLSPSCEQSNKESIASQFRDELTFLADKKEESGTLSNSEENVKVSTGTNQHFPESNHEENVNCSSLETHENANSLEENDRVARRRHRLNLREITRNIEWTVHPEGIVLANKNLRSQVSNERLRERQRDIVDDNTASMLHSAFFFKPEIITRIFRHAQSTTNESFSTVALRRRQDLSTNFVCRVNNEVIVRDQNTLFGLDFDQMMGRNDGLGCLLFSNVDIDNDNADNNRVTGEESSRNSYAISIELEQIVPESDIIRFAYVYRRKL